MEEQRDLAEFVEEQKAELVRTLDETPEQYQINPVMENTDVSLDSKIKAAYIRISDMIEEYYPDVGIAMSWGKDSMTILGLTLELYPELDIKLLFTDTERKFPETYEFADRIMQIRPQLIRLDYKPESPLLDCDTCRVWKVEAAVKAPKHFGLKALLVGIRHDECEARADTPVMTEVEDIVRCHPILEFTEGDIWAYMKEMKIPIHPLYTEGYRSIGCAPPCTVKTPQGAPERGGRQQDKEEIMHQLRGKGYW